MVGLERLRVLGIRLRPGLAGLTAAARKLISLKAEMQGEGTPRADAKRRAAVRGRLADAAKGISDREIVVAGRTRKTPSDRPDPTYLGVAADLGNARPVLVSRKPTICNELLVVSLSR